jgi:hypothetical protein
MAENSISGVRGFPKTIRLFSEFAGSALKAGQAAGSSHCDHSIQIVDRQPLLMAIGTIYSESMYDQPQ